MGDSQKAHRFSVREGEHGSTDCPHYVRFHIESATRTSRGQSHLDSTLRFLLLGQRC